MKRRAYGFTIVELLIVIVVVAILAALSYVGYTSISNRANDAAVKSDLTQLAKQVQLDYAESNKYLVGGGLRSSSDTGAPNTFPGFKFKPSKSSYYTSSGRNLFYCSGEIDGAPAARVVARSKSGNTYRYQMPGGLMDLGDISLGDNSLTACSGFDIPYTHAYGYYATNDAWWSWTN